MDGNGRPERGVRAWVRSRADERDQPFLLGVTNLKIPSYKSCFLALMRRFHDKGVTDLRGHLLYALPDAEYASANAWLDSHAISGLVDEAAAKWLAEYGSLVVDVYAAVGTSGGVVPALNLADALHLSDTGYGLVADAVVAKMTELGWP